MEMKNLAALTLRLPEDLIGVIDRHVGKRGRSEFVRDAIQSHSALLVLVRVFAPRPEARPVTSARKKAR
jgi:hypothetical protein